MLCLLPNPHEEKLSGSSGTNKRQKIAQDLINSIDQTGELLAMFEDNELDDVKQERMEVCTGVCFVLVFCSGLSARGSAFVCSKLGSKPWEV